MSLRARLAAWVDRTFWPGLGERQPCLSVAEVVANDDQPAGTSGGLVYLPKSEAWPDWRSVEGFLPEDAARRRARSLRVSLC